MAKFDATDHCDVAAAHFCSRGHHGRSLLADGRVVDVNGAVRVAAADVRLEAGDAVRAEAEHDARPLPEDLVCGAHPAASALAREDGFGTVMARCTIHRKAALTLGVFASTLSAHGSARIVHPQQMLHAEH